MRVTKAAVLTNKGLKIEDIWCPDPGYGQVLVKMAYSGLCRTQLMEVRGQKGEDPYLPHLLGHEGSGIVVMVGEGVTKVKANDSVVLSWLPMSGLSVSGGTYYDIFGETINAGPVHTFSEYVVVSENKVLPIEPDTPLDVAALLGCAIPTGAGAILNELKVTSSDNVAIVGCGGVGAAAFYTAIPIAKTVKVMESSFKGFHSYFDLVFEASGSKKGVEFAIAITKPTGKCVVASNLPKGEKIEIDVMELINGKEIVGTRGGSFNLEKDTQRLIGLNYYRSMIADIGKLEELPSLFNRLEIGVSGRLLVMF